MDCRPAMFESLYFSKPCFGCVSGYAVSTNAKFRVLELFLHRIKEWLLSSDFAVA